MIGVMGLVGTQTVHSYCDVPTVQFIGVRPPFRSEFQAFYRAAQDNGKVPVIAAFSDDAGLFATGSRVRAMNSYTYASVEKVFEKKPQRMVKGTKQIVYGVLRVDGKVSVNR